VIEQKKGKPYLEKTAIMFFKDGIIFKTNNIPQKITAPASSYFPFKNLE